MGLRKLKEYPKPPQMRVLKGEPDKNTKFPAWMLIVLMTVLTAGFIFKATQDENETLEEFVEWANQNAGKRRSFSLGNISEKIQKKINDSTGVNLKGFEWIIYSDDIVHIFKKHGNFYKEAARGQKKIEVNDFKKLYSVINSPDYLKDTLNIRNGVQYLILEKLIGNFKYVYISSISKKKKVISGKTMYIKNLRK